MKMDAYVHHDQENQNKQGRRCRITLLLAAEMKAEAGDQEVADQLELEAVKPHYSRPFQHY